MRAVLYRNDTPAGDAAIRFSLTIFEGDPTVADVTTTSNSVYVTDISDAATVNLANGIGFSEAVAIANSQSGTQTLVFTNALAGETVELAGDLSISECVGIDADAGGAFTLTGSVITAAEDVTLTIHNETGDQFTLASSVAGSATSSIQKTGAGKFTLSGTNTHSGAVVVSAGTLGVSGGASIGNSSAVSVASGASLSLDGGGETIGSLAGAGNMELTAYTLTLGGNNTSTSFSGVISSTGTSGFIKIGSGTFTLSGANTYTGSTTVNAGVLSVSGGSAIGNTSAVTVASGATLELAASETIGSLAGAGTVSLGSYTLTAGGNDTSTSFSGTIGGNGGLTKLGTGTFTLSGANTYNGATTVSAGTMLVTGALGATSSLNVNTGATLGGTGSIFAANSTNSTQLNNGSTLAPGVVGINDGAGALTINGNLGFVSSSTLSANINGTTAGTGHDQVVVKGTVNLTDSNLTLTRLGTYTPVAGSTYVLIDNDGSDAVTGTFASFSEGTTIQADGWRWSVSYQGGDGNDVVLTALDGTAPTLQSSTPPDNATGVSATNNLTLTFSEDVVAGEGLVSLRKSSDNSLVEQFDITSGEGSLGGQMSISGNTLALNPFADLAFGTGYYLETDFGIVKDAAGNYLDGITGAEGLNFTSVAAPVVPVQPDPTPPFVTIDGATVQTATSTNNDGSTTTTQTIAPIAPNRQEQSGDPSLANIPLATGNGETLLEIGLPAGVGATSEVTTGVGLTLQQQLTQATQNRADSASFNAILQTGIQQYVNSVTNPGDVLVRTITLTVPAGTTTAPGQPIVITGASGTGEGSTTHPTRQEALIIDARNLPPGTVLDLSQVEFAIIIGPSTIVGGTGRNFVVGDGSAQTIVLGADDDLLRGGAGNDTIGSKGGNDRLYGDEGNDTVVGGVGADHLEGGEGNDLLIGGSSDAGLWSFTLNESTNTLTANFQAASALLAQAPNWSLAGNWTTPLAPVDERIALINQDYASLKTISLLFKGLTGALPTTQSLNEFAKLGLNSEQLSALALGWWQSSQAQAQGAAEQVRSLISQVWGASQASEALIETGVRYLSEGGTLAQALLYLVEHANVKDSLTSAGQLSLSQASHYGEMGWAPESGNDALLGGAGNDVLVGGGGNDLLDGGAGTDLAVFALRPELYRVRVDADPAGGTLVVISNTLSGEVDTLKDIELLQMNGRFYQVNADRPMMGLGEEVALAPLLKEITAAQVTLMGVAAEF